MFWYCSLKVLKLLKLSLNCFSFCPSGWVILLIFKCADFSCLSSPFCYWGDPMKFWFQIFWFLTVYFSLGWFFFLNSFYFSAGNIQLYIHSKSIYFLEHSYNSCCKDCLKNLTSRSHGGWPRLTIYSLGKGSGHVSLVLCTSSNFTLSWALWNYVT